MIMTQEQAFLKAQNEFNQMVEAVRQATGEHRRIHEVERDLWQRFLSVNRALLEGFVAGYRTGDVGPVVESEGQTWTRLENRHDRRYVSIFGEICISRTVYGTRETQKHEVVPLDALLGLPASDFSYVLQDWDQAFCVQGAYKASSQSVQRILGIGQSVRSLEYMNVAMAQEVAGFRESQPPPAAAEEGSYIVLTADGKGIPMCRDDQPEGEPGVKHGRRKKGEKANKKRVACVGAVYSIQPFQRTTEEVVDEVMREKSKADRPAPKHKVIRAELTRPMDGEEVNGKDRIFGWFAEQLTKRDPGAQKPVVCIMDGDRALWKKAKQVIPRATFIIDLFHVMERLWSAAHCFHAEGSQEAQAFVTDRLRRILDGNVGRVIGGLQQMATKRGLRGTRLRTLKTAIGYLDHNREYMKYDEYLWAGFPIGSGVVEGTCRHLVKDRMEQTGMRWRIAGAQAMLDLRATYLNGDWESFNKDRIQREQQRLYPYRAALPAAA